MKLFKKEAEPEAAEALKENDSGEALAKKEMEELSEATVEGIKEADKEAVSEIDEEFLAQIKVEEEELKKQIPGFDLSEEIKKNPMFAVMLSFNEPMERVYGYFNPDYVYEQAERDILERIKARNLRPSHVEQRGKSGGYDVNRLTAKDMEEINRRVRRGERIEF